MCIRDRFDVVLGQHFQLLLGAQHVVLARLTVAGDPVELLLGTTTDVAHRHASLLSLVARELDVLPASLLGQQREHHPDRLAVVARVHACLLYTSPSPRDRTRSRMPSSA